jgi:hypothetical protein
MFLQDVLPLVGSARPALGEAHCDMWAQGGAADRYRDVGTGHQGHNRLPNMRFDDTCRAQASFRGEGGKGARPDSKASTGLLQLQGDALSQGYEMVDLPEVLNGVPYAHAPRMG